MVELVRILVEAVEAHLLELAPLQKMAVLVAPE
jgi:hypothetical protein